MYLLTHTIHEKEKDLEQKRRENPSLKPIYLKIEEKSGITELSLSKEEGSAIYCLSNFEYENLLDYFKIDKKFQTKSEEVFNKTPLNAAKKRKQGSIFSFIHNK